MARAALLSQAWQAEMFAEQRCLAAPRSRGGCEKSASVSYSSKTGGPAEMSATWARNCANETDVGGAHDGMELCRAGLLAHVDQLNR
jgi:hypothetical protein